jgi:outer membrane protein, heavy metal efflux system
MNTSMKRVLPFCLATIATLSATSPAPFLEHLTLDQAITIAAQRHPELAEARALALAAAGRADQAGARPNPEWVGRVESAPFRGDTFGQADYLAGVSQTIPLSRRLGRARQVESVERERILTDLEAKRLGIEQRVRGAFATALYHEHAAVAQSSLLDDAESAVRIAKARVDSGDTVPDDLARAEWDVARVRAEARRNRAMREQSIIALASAMGDPGLSIESLEGDLEVAFEIPTLESVASSLTRHPAVVAAHTDVLAQQARVDLARSTRIPDIRVDALYRRIESTRDHAFDLGFSVPFPLFDRNRGGLSAARAERDAAEARSRAATLGLEQRLRTAHVQLTEALANARVLKREIMPRADTVIQTWERRFAAGDIALLELIAVRREWAAVQLSYLESLRDVMQAWSELIALGVTSS